MRQHLKDRKYYEDFYDRQTIAIGWREGGILLEARELFYAKFGVKSAEEKNVLEFWWDRIFWWLVELPFLLPRWEERDSGINVLMAEDKQLDERLALARPIFEPRCTHCGKQGLRLVYKDLFYKDYPNRSVLFMFDCISCKKRSAYWEDGTEMVSEPKPCPKCSSPLESTTTSTKRFITTTTLCCKCDYKEVEKIDMTKPRTEEVDPNFERDKKLFCLTEERARTMQQYRIKWEDAMRMKDDEMKREADKDLYEMVAKVEQLKIPQLMERMRASIEKAGYIELSFDKPELGRYVTLGFSCMDGDSNREDVKSRKALKKAVNTALDNTNWRLMSEGISYRLGYLSGRIRAYEDEKDLIELLKSNPKKANS